MSDLDSIVSVSIDTQTTNPTQQGFGTPLALGFHTKFDERVRFYSQLSEMVTDGFDSDDSLYKLVRAILAQSPRPPEVAVGRLEAGVHVVRELTPVVANATEYIVEINGTEFSTTSDSDATAVEITEALRTAINAGTEPVKAVARNGKLYVYATEIGNAFDLVVDYALFAVQDLSDDDHRLSATSVMSKDLTPIVANATTYRVRVNGTESTFLSDGDATATEIVNGLLAAINGGAQAANVTASNVADKLRVISDVAGQPFTLEYTDAQFSALADNTPEEDGIADQLASLMLEEDGFYAVLIDTNGFNETENLATYVETLSRVFSYATIDGDVASVAADDIASTLQDLSLENTFGIFTKAAHEFPAAAWVGKVAPTTPGVATWAYKTLAGVSSTLLTPTEVARLRAKNINFYKTIAGVSITQDGELASGEFIDVTILVDWLTARLQEAIYSVKVNNQKVPFTDAGIALIDNAIRGVLAEGVTNGGLVDGSIQVIVPLAANVSDADKALRRLTGVTFQATLAGAIHKTVIQGTVTV